MSKKSEYVKKQKQTRPHFCHWKGCDKLTPPAMWGCKEHWFKLPVYLRNKIWDTYVPEQEVTMTPSDAYLDVAEEVDDWVCLNSSEEAERDIDLL